jgi:choice-of-anchor B domain-containing protein
MDTYPATGFAGCWGYTDSKGREYALLGVADGLSIVDITDLELSEKAFVKNKSSTWTEVKTYKHYAYVVKDMANAGIQIIDLSELPLRVKVVNTVMDYPQNHNIWIDQEKGLMFAVGGSNMGVTIWSLENPEQPRVITTFNGTTYVHDMYVRGNRAYLAEILSKSFSIYDISEIQKPVLVKRVRDPNSPSISFHNIWPTEDGKHLITTEETSGQPVRFWDISDERKPKEVARWLGPSRLAHNVHVLGNKLHIAHYGSGYRVLDISDITNPFEVSYFNARGTDDTGFIGVWGIYPYFKSKKVIMSSMEQGLFVVQYND